MNKEEAKQWLRTQIDSSLKTQIDSSIRTQIDSSIKMRHKYDKNRYNLCYNKNYLRALKLSKITGKPVNKEDFKGGEMLFRFDSTHKWFLLCDKIYYYLIENYSNNHHEHVKIVEEVFKDYEEYKCYKHW